MGLLKVGIDWLSSSFFCDSWGDPFWVSKCSIAHLLCNRCIVCINHIFMLLYCLFILLIEGMEFSIDLKGHKCSNAFKLDLFNMLLALLLSSYCWADQHSSMWSYQHNRLIEVSGTGWHNSSYEYGSGMHHNYIMPFLADPPHPPFVNKAPLLTANSKKLRKISQKGLADVRHWAVEKGKHFACYYSGDERKRSEVS